MGRGEQFGLVEQHELIGLGAEEHEAGLAEQVAAVDQPVFGRVPFDMALGIGQNL